MPAKFELKKGKKGQFMFNLKAANGEIILTSELYTSKVGAKRGIESVRKNAANDASYDQRSSRKKEPYFVLMATNGRIVGKSEMYTTNVAMKKGIAAFKKGASDAKVEDLTV